MNRAHEFLTSDSAWLDNRDSVWRALHFINATKGRGYVTGWTGPCDIYPGEAFRKITGGVEIRPFKFRLFFGRDGKPRVSALGRTVTLDSCK